MCKASASPPAPLNKPLQYVITNMLYGFRSNKACCQYPMVKWIILQVCSTSIGRNKLFSTFYELNSFALEKFSFQCSWLLTLSSNSCNFCFGDGKSSTCIYKYDIRRIRGEYSTIFCLWNINAIKWLYNINWHKLLLESPVTNLLQNTKSRFVLELQATVILWCG